MDSFGSQSVTSPGGRQKRVAVAQRYGVISTYASFELHIGPLR